MEMTAIESQKRLMTTYRLGKACVYRTHSLCVSRCSSQLCELKTLLCFKWKYQHAAVNRSSSGPGAKPWMAVPQLTPSCLAVCFVCFSILSEKDQALLLVRQEPHPGKSLVAEPSPSRGFSAYLKGRVQLGGAGRSGRAVGRRWAVQEAVTLLPDLLFLCSFPEPASGKGRPWDCGYEGSSQLGSIGAWCFGVSS